MSDASWTFAAVIVFGVVGLKGMFILAERIDSIHAMLENLTQRRS
jgi:hypothetical protein